MDDSRREVDFVAPRIDEVRPTRCRTPFYETRRVRLPLCALRSAEAASPSIHTKCVNAARVYASVRAAIFSRPTVVIGRRVGRAKRSARSQRCAFQLEDFDFSECEDREWRDNWGQTRSIANEQTRARKEAFDVSPGTRRAIARALSQPSTRAHTRDTVRASSAQFVYGDQRLLRRRRLSNLPPSTQT